MLREVVRRFVDERLDPQRGSGRARGCGAPRDHPGDAGHGPVRPDDPGGVRRPGADHERGSPDRLRVGAHLLRLPLGDRHHRRHRQPGHRHGRHARAEGRMAAQARHRGDDRELRPDRARRRLRRRLDHHHGDQGRRRLPAERDQALHHQCAARGHVHGDGHGASRT